jgi:hypothetical protein
MQMLFDKINHIGRCPNQGPAGGKFAAAKSVTGRNGKTKTKGGQLRTAGIGKMPAKVDADWSRLRRLRE